jgi:hypothetical protein
MSRRPLNRTSQPSRLDAHRARLYNEGVRLTWHEVKRRRDLKDHGLDFVDAPQVFEGPTYTFDET